jgi:hypothetical protein
MFDSEHIISLWHRSNMVLSPLQHILSPLQCHMTHAIPKRDLS